MELDIWQSQLRYRAMPAGSLCLSTNLWTVRLCSWVRAAGDSWKDRQILQKCSAGSLPVQTMVSLLGLRFILSLDIMQLWESDYAHDTVSVGWYKAWQGDRTKWQLSLLLELRTCGKEAGWNLSEAGELYGHSPPTKNAESISESS